MDLDDDLAGSLVPKSSIILEGNLMKKRPKGWMKIWQTRYVMLTNEYLCYSRTESSKVISSVALKNIASVRLQPWKKSGCRFDILLKDKTRIFSFLSDELETATKWVDEIRRHLIVDDYDSGQQNAWIEALQIDTGKSPHGTLRKRSQSPTQSSVSSSLTDVASDANRRRSTMIFAQFLKMSSKNTPYGVIEIVHKDHKKYWRLLSHPDSSTLEKGKTRRAITTLQSMLHPFMSSPVFAGLDPNGSNDWAVFVLPERGSLYDYLKSKGRIDVEIVRFIGAQVVLLMKLVHRNKFNAPSLDPEHLMIKDNGYICLYDFRFLDPTKSTLKEYETPEKEQSHLSDLWRFGILLYELAVGIPPFRPMYTKKSKLQFPPWVNANFRDLIVQLLEVDPEDRLGASDFSFLQHHEFFKECNWSSIASEKEASPLLKRTSRSGMHSPKPSFQLDLDASLSFSSVDSSPMALRTPRSRNIGSLKLEVSEPSFKASSTPRARNLSLGFEKMKKQTTIDKMSERLRKVVSKKKLRFQKDGFDLDLSYITPQIIAMGFPTDSGTFEGVYRNPMEEVQRFFEHYHEDHFKIYNLCSERSYNPELFNYKVETFPFDDHNSPPFQMILHFCEDLHSFLSSDPSNVAGIHCKAGKGRTGTMIASYLLFDQILQDPAEALSLFASKRTSNGKGVTIPSQIRYVYYFDQYLKEYDHLEKEFPWTGTTVRLKSISFGPVLKNGLIPYFKVFNATGKRLYDWEKGHELETFKKGDTVHFFPEIYVRGDFKVVFYSRSSFGSKKMFQYWLNTVFIKDNRVELLKSQIDKAVKDKKHKHFHQDLKVDMLFEAAPQDIEIHEQSGDDGSDGEELSYDEEDGQFNQSLEVNSESNK